MTPSEVIGAAASFFFFILAVSSARTAYRTLRLGRNQELPRALFWSITKTVWLIGPLLVAAVLYLFLSDGPAHDSGGIMSREMGISVLIFGAALGLLMIWASAIALGMAAGAAARNLPPAQGTALVFGILCLTPLLCVGSFKGSPPR